MAARVKTAKQKIDWASEIRQIIWLVLAVLGVHSFIAKPFYIPSESMLPGLLTGDRLIVSKFPYGYSYLSLSVPKISFNGGLGLDLGSPLPFIEGRLFGRLPTPGDIAVIKSPVGQVDYIKRVVALPGDQVMVRGGKLYLNGAAIRRDPMAPTEIVATANTDCVGPFAQYRAVRDDGVAVCRYPRFRETLPNGRSYEVLDLLSDPRLDEFGPEIVPADHVFMMGDNRDNSQDSRVPAAVGGVGMLPIENLVGRAEFLTFSLDGSTTLNPLTWFGALRPGRFFESLHPDAE